MSLIFLNDVETEEKSFRLFKGKLYTVNLFLDEIDLFSFCTTRIFDKRKFK